ncbi:PRI1 primase, partial [Glaucidium brasilianum]|nr:PRI1 primase [Glaucidium brasilianum]
EDLGMRHRLWVYSGRRGVHCWVCDDDVRKWSPALRAAAVEYLTLVKVGTWGGRAPPARPPVLPTAVPPGRTRDREEAGSAASAISLDRRAQHREALQRKFPKKRDSGQRWELLKGQMERTRQLAAAGKGTACFADWEIMLQYCFPRLDINVSKGVGHLLKSPFSVHPKTGRISVPLDLQRLDQFDPFAVPTIRCVSGARWRGGSRLRRRPPPRPTISRSSLCHELDTAGSDGEQEDGGETEPKRRVRDYKKTSLAPYVRVFEQFVEEMERARRGERLRRSGRSRAG